MVSGSKNDLQMVDITNKYWDILGISWEYHGNIMGYNIMGYPLVMTNSLPWYSWPIEIDGLAIKNGDFPWLC